ncbi:MULTISPECIES: DUF1826 domain-containing protein [Pseudoalteromonas]|uniref:DUF1826 domain-containing protein n=1 Tax=Pseudoalteromonas amylolytica TaxID=1859457 RepID=A0A1S1MQ87_9GAMM|nr:MULTISPECIES: DUF1826 domain-containing protein [Pseudoalteromonas]OHU85795.1 hypothetical protein BFC16_18015 [Pseudoalteromonas sp. JW3]OHU87303.1 hypothetical protein BET10_20380 [Pseudoalteromonas amylolytica]
MALAKQLLLQSWASSSSPESLTEIVSQDISVAIWQRENNPIINRYFEAVFSSLGLGIRNVFTMNSLKAHLDAALPNGIGKLEVIEDIYLLSDMLTCLFGCKSVGLRLAPLSSAMCPKLHVDQIPVRLVNTYLGEGTQWLPSEAIHQCTNMQAPLKLKTAVHNGFYSESSVNQLNAFDVALLKGSAWQEGQVQMAAIHRSCQVALNSKRVLLTLDPM